MKSIDTNIRQNGHLMVDIDVLNDIRIMLELKAICWRNLR